ncbi:MAG: hypothetical protein RMJ19_14600 [Gemmatales bacterium]|nr:hypothetical protein [Gemmatales bacterium]MCS7161698.1 hypothetical protein [Gemmatales bacterium]MDW8176901.1 hypothetical protein [Gemmatales bacterium]MDW8221822.1 hypothetical protein [Gemmatales bacterium]
MTHHIEGELADLQEMSTDRLCQRYTELYGKPTQSRGGTHPIHKIIGRLYASADGELYERARSCAEDLALGRNLRGTPPQAPPALAATALMTPCKLTAPRTPAHGTALVC